MNYMAQIAERDRANNLDVAYRLLHEACTEAMEWVEGKPESEAIYNRLRIALIDCEEFLGKP